MTRLVLDVAALVTVGLSLLPKLLGFDHPRGDRGGGVPGPPLGRLLGDRLGLRGPGLDAAERRRGDAGPVPRRAAVRGRDRLRPGLVVSRAAAVFSAAIGMFAVRFGEKVPAELRVGAAVFGLLPLPVTGHASNWYWHDLSMVAMELHVIGAALWTGGLLAVALLLVADRELLGRTLPRFSKLATTALLVVSLSGLFTGLVELLLSPAETVPRPRW